MNFLGMGPLELVLIVVLALIVFGPAKLPEIMGQIGKAIGDFRRATSELSDEFNRTIQAELNETKQTIEETKSALTEVRSAVDTTVSETRAAVAGMPAPTRVATPTMEPPVANGHDETTSNGATTETSPPLADTSQWSWETSPATPAEAEEAAPVAEAGPGTEAAPIAEPTAEPPEAAPVAEPSAEPPEASAESVEHTIAPPDRSARDELQPPY
jgi:sec-independent protein translocase protein TatB